MQRLATRAAFRPIDLIMVRIDVVISEHLLLLDLGGENSYGDVVDRTMAR